MSPLWRDEVAIYLAPRKLALARRLKGLKPRIGASTELAVAGSGEDAAAALARLGEVLCEATWQNAHARIVIADAWVRFGIVPAAGAGLDAAARRTHAGYVLADTYGEMVSDWQLAVEEVPPGMPSVACAMPPEIGSALAAVLASAKLSLRSVQPQLAVAFNAWRRHLPPDDAWFVTLQDGWLSAVHLARGKWDRVQTVRLSGEPAVEIERLQAYGRLAAGSTRMFVDAPPWMRERLRRVQTDVQWLESDDAEPTHELALLLRASA